MSLLKKPLLTAESAKIAERNKRKPQRTLCAQRFNLGSFSGPMVGHHEWHESSNSTNLGLIGNARRSVGGQPYLLISQSDLI